MRKIAVFPGSFDPVTKGHESIVIRAVPLFDEIIVAIGENSEKIGYFSIEKRLDWLKKVFKNYSSVKVMTYHGLTVDLCKELKANYILRGLRTSADFEFERNIGQVNKNISPKIETIFLLTAPEFTHLNSSIVREIHKYKGDIKQFIPNKLTFLR
ncbi:MAG: pantetheine-phosphate adenylyltransferase [Bacteroidetes bacterium]|nr:pantetheine-phosphate adenylyltransferase [Bacteroidota bacterium]